MLGASGEACPCQALGCRQERAMISDPHFSQAESAQDRLQPNACISIIREGTYRFKNTASAGCSLNFTRGEKWNALPGKLMSWCLGWNALYPPALCSPSMLQQHRLDQSKDETRRLPQVCSLSTSSLDPRKATRLPTSHPVQLTSSPGWYQGEKCWLVDQIESCIFLSALQEIAACINRERWVFFQGRQGLQIKPLKSHAWHCPFSPSPCKSSNSFTVPLTLPVLYLLQ